MRQDILIQLELDPLRLTLGELMQERDVAANEIRQLRADCEKLRSSASTAQARSQVVDHVSARPRTLIRLSDLCEQLSISRSTIYKWLDEDKFPAPVRIGERAVRWRVVDIEQWCSALEAATL